MSQVVGAFSVSELSRSRLRPRELSVPVEASPTYFAKTGSTYNSQSMQVVDKLNNTAGLIKTIPSKTVTRVIQVTFPLVGSIIRTKLPYSIGGGVLRFTNNDDTVPSGILKVYDCRDTANGYIAVGPGSTMDIPAGQQEVVLGISVLTAKTIVTICYNMEVYVGAITFNTLPVVGDLITFGDYARFEFVSGGAATTGNIPVTIGGDMATTITNLLTAFNTTYVAAIKPTNSMVPFMWARLLADDLVYLKSGSNWINAADSGIVIYSVDQGLINNASVNSTNCQALSNL